MRLFFFLLIVLSFSSFININTTFANNNSEKSSCEIDIQFDYEVSNLNVAFTNYSQGKIDHCEWDFGDSKTSKAFHPIHQYKKEGKYKFCFTAYTKDKQCQENFCGEVYVFK